MSNYLRLRNFPKVQGQAPTAETEICFVNASLQLLNSLPECRRYFVEKQYKTQDSPGCWPAAAPHPVLLCHKLSNTHKRIRIQMALKDWIYKYSKM